MDVTINVIYQKYVVLWVDTELYVIRNMVPHNYAD